MYVCSVVVGRRSISCCGFRVVRSSSYTLSISLPLGFPSLTELCRRDIQLVNRLEHLMFFVIDSRSWPVQASSVCWLVAAAPFPDPCSRWAEFSSAPRSGSSCSSSCRSRSSSAIGGGTPSAAGVRCAGPASSCSNSGRSSSGCSITNSAGGGGAPSASRLKCAGSASSRSSGGGRAGCFPFGAPFRASPGRASLICL